MEQPLYDIAIIGLGPAGSTLARLLPDNLKIIAFDKKNDGEDSFKKPCAGMLSHHGQECFAKYGLTLPDDVLVTQLFSAKVIDLKHDSVRNYRRLYINMDRHRFDLWLKSMIPEYVDIHDSVLCRSLVKTDDCYEITVLENHQEIKYRAKYVIGADGAGSMVRKFLFPEHRIKTYMSIQQWFPARVGDPSYSLVFDGDLTDSYAWGLNKNEYYVFGGAYPMKHAREKFEEMKRRLKAYGYEFDNPVKTEACLVLSPSSLRQLCCGRDNCFLIGEAAGFISPSSLEGISYAIESAYKLGDLFNRKKQVSVKDYRKAVFSLRLKLAVKMIKRHFIMGAFLRRVIMLSGLGAISMITAKPEKTGKNGKTE